jgi:hypothetical protein
MKIILFCLVASLLVCNLECATILVTNNTKCEASPSPLIISILVYNLESAVTNSSSNSYFKNKCFSHYNFYHFNSKKCFINNDKNDQIYTGSLS